VKTIDVRAHAHALIPKAFALLGPDRFMGFASVTLQDRKLAVEPLEHAVKKLGMKGPAVGASCAGDEFSDAKFHPFWAKCEELGVLVFIHPQSTPRRRCPTTS
jgi:aminocarboxymuconate-semialdehyde decarboxylase